MHLDCGQCGSPTAIDVEQMIERFGGKTVISRAAECFQQAVFGTPRMNDIVAATQTDH